MRSWNTSKLKQPPAESFARLMTIVTYRLDQGRKANPRIRDDQSSKISEFVRSFRRRTGHVPAQLRVQRRRSRHYDPAHQRHAFADRSTSAERSKRREGRRCAPRDAREANQKRESEYVAC